MRASGKHRVTERVAEYVAGGSFDVLTAEVVEAVTQVAVDCVGSAIAGRVEASARNVARVVEYECSHHGRSTVLASGRRTSASGAAFANGTAAHALDIDDTHHPGLLHPSAVLVPCLFALGEESAVSGREIICAYVYALDVMSVLASAVNPEHYRRGWHATATLGSLMAAVAACKLLGENAETTLRALGIASSFSGGLRCNFGTMMKPVHAGMAARNGVLAAKLAGEGLTANESAIDGPGGFFDAFSDAGEAEVTAALSNLDKKPGHSINGLAIKRFASCGATHPPIEALLNLRNQYSLSPEAVKAIKCTVNPFVPSILIHENPSTGLEGKFSLQHCLAVALVDGAADLAQFTDARVRDDQVRAAAEKVHIQTDPEVGMAGEMSWGAVVSLELASGEEVACAVDIAKGKWIGQRLNWEEIQRKFFSCCSYGKLSFSEAQAVLQKLRRFPELETVVDIFDLAEVFEPTAELLPGA
jgi:2-methylcitrate dehydratase PrpD